MLSETDRKDFKELIEEYESTLSPIYKNEREIRDFVESCGASTDPCKLAKIIQPLPDPSFVRRQLIQKYYELADEPPIDINELPPLDRKTQIATDTLASAYSRLLNEKDHLQREIFNMAKERGVFNDIDSLEEVVSLFNFDCFPRVRFVLRLQMMRKEHANPLEFVSPPDQQTM